jgi:hypothetical protein
LHSWAHSLLRETNESRIAHKKAINQLVDPSVADQHSENVLNAMLKSLEYQQRSDS